MNEHNHAETEELEIDIVNLIQNFISGIWKLWWLIVLLALIGGSIFYLRASRFYTPLYRAEATFTVMTSTQSNSENSSSYNFYYDSTTAGQLAKTFPYILSSNLLNEAIKEDLGISSINGSITANVVPDSNLITMSVVSTDAWDAKTILESAIRVYPNVSRFVIGNTKFNMIDLPTKPTEPFNKPNYTTTTAKGAFLGVIAGLLLVVLYAFFKKTVQKPEELKKVSSLNCLAKIPEVKQKARRKSKEQRVTILGDHVGAGFRENIKGLQMRVKRELEKLDGKVLLVTSTASEEGKTTMAVNLAFSLASYGHKVLLLDGDMRKQTDWKYIEGAKGKGLYEVLCKECTVKDAVFHDKKSGVFFLGGKEPVKEVIQTLNSSNLPDVLASLKEEMDYVIIDSPPSEIFEDAAVLSEYADGILYVVRYDFIQRRRVLDGLTELEGVHAKLIGYAFNGIKVSHSGYGYGYGYSYGYGYRYGYGRYGQYGDDKHAHEEK